MPLRTAQRQESIAAATGRSEVDRHAECTHHLQLYCTYQVNKTGAQTEPGGEQFSEPDRSQRTYQDFDSQA